MQPEQGAGRRFEKNQPPYGDWAPELALFAVEAYSGHLSHSHTSCVRPDRVGASLALVRDLDFGYFFTRQGSPETEKLAISLGRCAMPNSAGNHRPCESLFNRSHTHVVAFVPEADGA